jgi:hypothetical protein
VLLYALTTRSVNGCAYRFTVGQQCRRTGEEGYRFVIPDRDHIYSGELDQSLKSLGLTVLKTPSTPPQANAFCERHRQCTLRVFELQRVMVAGSGTVARNLTSFIEAESTWSKRLSCVVRLSSDIGFIRMKPLNEPEENVPVAMGDAISCWENVANTKPVNDPKNL